MPFVTPGVRHRPPRARPTRLGGTTWSDEFDGSSVNLSKWSFEVGDGSGHASAANATHAIFLFGTNDVRYTKMDKFVSEYTELIRLFQRKPPIRILIGVPPPLRWANPDLVGPQTRSATIAEKALPDLLRTIANNVGADLPIDLRAPWYERCPRTAGTCRLMQRDGLHPNNAGTELIARTFARALRHRESKRAS